ncbi:unnamed protein product, partial [Adineta steineri]
MFIKNVLQDESANAAPPATSSIESTAPPFIQKPIIKQENDSKRLIFECKIAADPKPDLFWSRESNAHIPLNLDKQSSSGRRTFTQAPQVRMFEESVLLECRCTAEPVPSFTWTLDGKPITMAARYKQRILSEGNTHIIFLEIAQLTAKDSGAYKVTAKNVKGDGVANIQLNIEGIDFKLPEDAKTATVQIDIIADPSL